MGEEGVSEVGVSIESGEKSEGGSVDTSAVVADRLETETGRDALKDLANMTLADEAKIRRMNESESVDSNHKIVGVFSKINVMAYILEKTSVSKEEFDYGPNNHNEAQRNLIIESSNVDANKVRGERVYEDGKKGVDDANLHHFLLSDASQKAKEYILIHALMKGEESFNDLSMDDENNSELTRCRNEAIGILSRLYSEEIDNQDKSNRETKEGENNKIDIDNLLKNITLEDYIGLDDTSFNLSEESLSGDTKALFSRFHAESRLKAIEKALSKSDNEKIIESLKKYKINLLSFIHRELDAEMDVSDQIHLHNNVHFVYKSVRKLVNKYQ